jgi:hypothetical protein
MPGFKDKDLLICLTGRCVKIEAGYEAVCLTDMVGIGPELAFTRNEITSRPI